MSSIDLSNPGVLKNFLISQMKENKGEFVYREKVLLFKDNMGNEFIAPEEILKDLEVLDIDTNEIIMEVKAPIVDENGNVKEKKNKKKLLVKTK